MVGRAEITPPLHLTRKLALRPIVDKRFRCTPHYLPCLAPMTFGGSGHFRNRAAQQEPCTDFNPTSSISIYEPILKTSRCSDWPVWKCTIPNPMNTEAGAIDLRGPDRCHASDLT